MDPMQWLRDQIAADADRHEHTRDCQMLQPVPPIWGGPLLGDTMSCNCRAARDAIALYEAHTTILDAHKPMQENSRGDLACTTCVDWKGVLDFESPATGTGRARRCWA